MMANSASSKSPASRGVYDGGKTGKQNVIEAVNASGTGMLKLHHTDIPRLHEIDIEMHVHHNACNQIGVHVL